MSIAISSRRLLLTSQGSILSMGIRLNQVIKMSRSRNVKVVNRRVTICVGGRNSAGVPVPTPAAKPRFSVRAHCRRRLLDSTWRLEHILSKLSNDMRPLGPKRRALDLRHGELSISMCSIHVTSHITCTSRCMYLFLQHRRAMTDEIPT